MVLYNLVKNKMTIELGRCYANRTVKYLVPGLNFYGPTLKLKMNSIFKLGFGIHDSLLDGSHLEGQKNIFILVDKLVRNDLFINFIDWVKHQEYYVTDYPYDSVEHIHSRLHMIVLAFPSSMEDAYDKFLLGKYSQMYTKEEIQEFFGEENKAAARNVFAKTMAAKENFKVLVRETYGEALDHRDFAKGVWEFDLPPSKDEEIFNIKELGIS